MAATQRSDVGSRFYMRQMTKKEALEWIAQTFEEDPNRISETTSRDQIAAWDSLGILTLMANLDQDFGLVLPSGVVQTWSSVGDVLASLKENGRLKE